MQAVGDAVDCIVCSRGKEDVSSNDDLQDHPQSTNVDITRFYAE